MTTYNTGNPIGSTSPKDLYDNAQNFDELVNNLDEEFYPDRLGVERKTWHGIEKEFNEFMQSAGFVTIGNYAGGIEITAYNQVLVDSSGVQWRLNPETPLPYTTTGAGLPEGNNFINMGDLVYRSELGSAAYLDAGSAAEALATNLQVFTIIRSLGLNSTLVPLDGQDLDATTVPTGFYSVNFADLWENNPFGAQPDLAIFNLLKSESTAFQLAMSMSSNEVAWRSADASTTFGSWSYLPSVLQTTGDSTTSAMSQKAVTEALQWQSTPVGSVLSMRYGTSEPPKDSSLYRYVKLTANQTGSGQYNEGILTNQTTTGSGATLRITAKINFPSSPLHDITIDLTNSCSIATEAGTTRGEYEGDKMQNVTGTFGYGMNGFASTGTGVFTGLPRTSANSSDFSSPSSLEFRGFEFNMSTVARTGDRTKPKTVTEEEYLRIL